jgi:ABC-type glycerol-3-phosphate transport system permease component
MISFKTPEEIYSFPPKWYPGQIHFNNYYFLFRDGDAITVWNSLVIAGSSTVIAMFLGTICAYSLARFRTGGEHLANWIISQRMIPPVAVVFPIFLLFVWLHLVDTYIGVIILYTAFNLPYVIWMMRGYILDIPKALEESALVDGCTRWQVIWKVVFPMCRAGLFATAIFTCAGPHAQRSHDLYGADHAFLRRPIEFLGKNFGDVGAGHAADIHRRGVHAKVSGAGDVAWSGERLTTWLTVNGNR